MKKEKSISIFVKKPVSPDEISEKILFFRQKKVMLDSDLAQLYGVLTGLLNLAVKRNIDRFPSDFMFQLTKEEAESLILQFAISNKQNKQNKQSSKGRGGRRKLPYVFTEQGVAMLSSVLTQKLQLNQLQFLPGGPLEKISPRFFLYSGVKPEFQFSLQVNITSVI